MHIQPHSGSGACLGGFQGFHYKHAAACCKLISILQIPMDICCVLVGRHSWLTLPTTCLEPTHRLWFCSGGFGACTPTCKPGDMAGLVLGESHFPHVEEPLCIFLPLPPCDVYTYSTCVLGVILPWECVAIPHPHSPWRLGGPTTLGGRALAWEAATIYDG